MKLKEKELEKFAISQIEIKRRFRTKGVKSDYDFVYDIFLPAYFYKHKLSDYRIKNIIEKFCFKKKIHICILHKLYQSSSFKMTTMDDEDYRFIIYQRL